VDHDFPLLVAKDAEGRIRGLYFNYACHCVTLSDNRIGGDWAGYAQSAVERAFPDAIALCSVGCGADSNPSSGVTGDKGEVAAAQGDEIAAEVRRLLAAPLTAVEGPIIQKMESVRLPFDTIPTEERWKELAAEPGAVGYHARVQLDKLARGEAIRTFIDYPIQSWAFGDDLAMVFLPGEVVVDYSLRLKRELDRSRLWINAYSNDSPCYIPSERVLVEGGYEGAGAMIYYDQPTRLKAGLEETIVSTVVGQLGTSFPPSFRPDGTMGSLPLSPAQALAAFKLHSDLVIEVVAAEPLIQSPVAVDFGADGRLYVAEMFDYPLGLDGQYQPGGRIKALEDTDGDGRFDRAHVFIDGIPFPTGVTAWRDGVLIGAAPEVLFARDTNGDGRADEKHVLYSGFGADNYQARVNSLEYGLDGWIYGSCGLFGGTIDCPLWGRQVELGDRDFCFRPETGELEPATGRTQQGRVRDDWGNWFGCDNSNLLRHYPLAERDLGRNPLVIPPSASVSLSQGPDAVRLYPVSHPTLYKLSGQAGQVTSACGLGLYRDSHLSPEYEGNAFTCEPVNNVVHRRVMQSSGVTFTAHRAPAEENREFLASTDAWFRPVQVRTAPDGSLIVVDMYRYVIEHPRWIPPEDVARLDVRAGHDRGRIFRIFHRDRPPRIVPRLDRLLTEELASLLSSPNGTLRDKAQILLEWRRPEGAARAIAQLASAPSPATRVQALWTLSNLGQVTREQVEQALADPAPRVRANGVRIARRLLNGSPNLGIHVAALVDDDVPRVRLEAALALGDWDDGRASAALARFLIADAADPYPAAAGLSSLSPRSVPAVLAAILDNHGKRPELLAQVLVMAVEWNCPAGLAAIGSIIDEAADEPVAWRRQVLEVLCARIDGLDRRLRESGHGTQFDRYLNLTRRQALDDTLPEEDRRAAVSILARLSPSHGDDVELLGGLLESSQSTHLQRAAIDALVVIDGAPAAEQVIRSIPRLTPDLQGAALDAVLSREMWFRMLLEEVQAGRMPATYIDSARRERIAAFDDPAIREQAARHLSTINVERARVLESKRHLAELRGDAVRGKSAFEKRCADCHRLSGIGHAVGPDLTGFVSKSPLAMLAALLDPNQAVDPRYAAFTAVTRDGRTHVGLLADESASSVRLLAQGGKEYVLARSEIEELFSSGRSLMPEGLELELTDQEFTDLIAFVREVAVPFKSLAGNHPALIRASDDGSLLLDAARAMIRGNEITYEEPTGNIGFWHGADDWVAWDVMIERAARYKLVLRWACDDASANNPYTIDAGGASMEGQVQGTGGWSQYREQQLGTIELPAGRRTVILRPTAQPQWALMDLAWIRLIPQ
jgi:putative membrane-bound dehydrogenase-like protein